MAEEERDHLLSASHTVDNDDAKYHSISSSADVASSIKDVSITDNSPNAVASSLFRKSSSASKSHRRVVSRDSDSDEDSAGPPVVSRQQQQLVTETVDDGDNEIGPPAPAGDVVQKVMQNSVGQDESSDEEIGPPLPETAPSDKDVDQEEDDNDNDDDDDDDDDEVQYICIDQL